MSIHNVNQVNKDAPSHLKLTAQFSGKRSKSTGRPQTSKPSKVQRIKAADDVNKFTLESETQPNSQLMSGKTNQSQILDGLQKQFSAGHSAVDRAASSKDNRSGRHAKQQLPRQLSNE